MKSKYEDFMKKAEGLSGDAKAKMERRATIFKPKEEEREKYVNEVIRLENELKKLKSRYIILSGGGKRSRRNRRTIRRKRRGTRKI
jgi:PP-loop superfamily ATP-utilizing enzyme